MDKALWFIIAISMALVTFGVYFLVKKLFPNKGVKITNWVVSWVLFALLFVWLLLCGGGYLRDIINLTHVDSSDPAKYAELIANGGKVAHLAIYSFWFIVVIHITSMLSPWFEFKVIHRMELFISPILAIYCFATLPEFIYAQTLSYGFSVAGLFIAMEVGVIIGKIAFKWAFDRISLKMNREEVVELVLCTLGAILFTMQEFMPRALFGNVNIYGMKGFGLGHRYYLYAEFIFLIGLPLLLRARKGEYSRMIMLYIAIGGMIAFTNGYKFSIFITPKSWPMHICNTAMYILPIALVTRSQKVFYFTFFINILGAMLASFMPDYSAQLNIFSPRSVEWFTNHTLAFAGPLVCVLLDIFPRPKKRQFFYSMVGFAIYYCVVLFFNTYFSAKYPLEEFDYFFINSDFIAKKVGGEKVLYDHTLTWEKNGMHFKMYPLYQTIYFFGFILMSIGMWYVYAWIFSFQDKLEHINQRVKKIKLDRLALETKLGQKEVSRCMNPESVNKLVISHFGKKYSAKSPFAVRDINFVAEAGEIIGFLGPNGAGKSTTIKAIVGIHLPTEGKIEINGYDVEVQPVQAKKQIGFVPDHYALYENLTGREYLNYIADIYDVSKEDRDAFLNEMLEMLAMKDAIDNKIQTYSHGMKQKIAIMASIIHNPKIWILDEPLTGLDPVSIFQVKQCLKRHAEKGNIVFFSSHLIDIVEKLCDRIIIISDHKVQDVANVKELLKKGVNLEQYYMDKTGLATGN